MKLFLKGFPVSLPHWFRYGNSCKLSKKSMLENFPSYLKGKAENLCFLDELKKHQFQNKQDYSADVIQYALLLRYTSIQLYKLLPEKFPLPSVSLLNKIKEGKIDSLKVTKLLMENKFIKRYYCFI